MGSKTYLAGAQVVQVTPDLVTELDGDLHETEDSGFAHMTVLVVAGLKMNEKVCIPI